MLLLLTLLACGSGSEPTPSATAASATLALTPIEATRYRPEIELTGSLDPAASVQLGFQVGGRLAALLVHRGDAVTAGQALARLEADLASAQLAQAEAAVEGAAAQLAAGEAAFQRATALHEARGMSDQQYQDAKAAVEAGRAGLEQARAAARLAKTNLRFQTLTSPIAGVVSGAPDNAGTVVGPGTPLFLIEDLSALQLKATAPETATWLSAGLTATVISGAGASASATVTRVLPALDPVTRRLPVELRVDAPPPAMRAHSFARATVQSATEVDAWQVPRTAVVARPEYAVFVVPAGAPDSAEPARVPVSVISETTDRAILQGALQAGDRVVVEPPSTLGAQ